MHTSGDGEADGGGGDGEAEGGEARRGRRGHADDGDLRAFMRPQYARTLTTSKARPTAFQFSQKPSPDREKSRDTELHARLHDSSQNSQKPSSSPRGTEKPHTKTL